MCKSVIQIKCFINEPIVLVSAQFVQNYTPPFGYQAMYNSFQYKDADKLQGSPIQGKFNTYDGSGFVYEMRGQLSFIQGNLTLLKEMN